MREFSHKLISFALIVAEGGPMSQAILKKHIDSLSAQRYQIDSEMQKFKQQSQLHIPNLEAAKLELQKQIVKEQVDLELLLAKGKKARG